MQRARNINKLALISLSLSLSLSLSVCLYVLRWNVLMQFRNYFFPLSSIISNDIAFWKSLSSSIDISAHYHAINLVVMTLHAYRMYKLFEILQPILRRERRNKSHCGRYAIHFVHLGIHINYPVVLARRQSGVSTE